jgi:transposase
MAEKRTRRRFTAEYKAHAVKRLLEGGRGLSEVATELGVSSGQLSTWRTWRQVRQRLWPCARPRRRRCCGSSVRTSGSRRRT